MNPRECGYLLLSSKLGIPDRRPLSTAQLRLLAQRAAYLPETRGTQELTMAHLLSLGLERQLAERVFVLNCTNQSINRSLFFLCDSIKGCEHRGAS